MVENLPENPFDLEDPSPGVGSSSGSSSLRVETNFFGRPKLENMTVPELVHAIQSTKTRDRAMHLLSKNYREHEDLGLLLWESFGTMAILLKEIIFAYPVVTSNILNEPVAYRLCNVLALIQCVAAHPATRMKLITAHFPVYLYPLIDNSSNEKPYEYLRVSTLGVIGALIKNPEESEAAVHYLLGTQLVPVCLRCMEIGLDLSKTLATFIIHKILVHTEGLKYCSTMADRFFAIRAVLGNVVNGLNKSSDSTLLKHIIGCYLKLSESTRACHVLSSSTLAARLKESACIIQDDPAAMDALRQLLHNISTRPPPPLLLQFPQMGRAFGRPPQPAPHSVGRPFRQQQPQSRPQPQPPQTQPHPRPQPQPQPQPQPRPQPQPPQQQPQPPRQPVNRPPGRPQGPQPPRAQPTCRRPRHR